MRILDYDRIKLPEGIRLPWAGGKMYKLASTLERRAIKKEIPSPT